MTSRRFRIPSTSALIAFESAARHCNFSHAAEELNTSQSAISRHISDMEARLGVMLFLREKKRLRLTEAGEYFYRAVVSGLENIQAAGKSISNWFVDGIVTIACTHEISHLFLMPRFEAMQAVVGDTVQIRLMTYEYDALAASLDPRIDLMFAYHMPATAPEGWVAVFREAVRPLCSPQFAEENKATLSKDICEWGALPFLQLTKQNKGWATWNEWFALSGAADLTPKFLRFDNYVYLLEACVAGRGIALGWKHLADQYVERGALVALDREFVEFDRQLFAFLTPHGINRADALKCLNFLRSSDLD